MNRQKLIEIVLGEDQTVRPVSGGRKVIFPWRKECSPQEIALTVCIMRTDIRVYTIIVNAGDFRLKGLFFPVYLVKEGQGTSRCNR